MCSLSNFTDSPRLFHDHPSLVIGILSDENISDSKSEAFSVQEIGEQLGESGLQFARIFSSVQFKESVDQTELSSTVLIFVKNS